MAQIPNVPIADPLSQKRVAEIMAAANNGNAEEVLLALDRVILHDGVTAKVNKDEKAAQ